MQKYALHLTGKLFDRLAEEVERASESGDADAIHDLRVAIRRLSRCLRVFAQFYASGSWKKVRERLSEMLHLAGAVRDRDIALELLAKAGVSKRAAVAGRLQEERRKAGEKLLAEVRDWHERNVVSKWRDRLTG